ncbi:MAG: ABC transporter permease [Bacillota bacterium]
MTFFRLAFTNVSRNLGRSVLSVIAMAVAAFVMTSSSSVAQGYPRDSFLAQRAFIGGDIIVYPDQYRLGGPTADDRQTYARTAADALNDLPAFHPELRDEGYVRRGPTLPNVIDLRQVQQRLWNEKAVKLIYPYYALPGFAGGPGGQSTPLRGRNTLLDQSVWHLYDYVTAGRYLTSADDGKFVAVVDARQAKEGRDVPPVGTSIEVSVPAVRQDPDGTRWYDYSTMKTFNFEVIGQIALPTRLLAWPTPPNGSASEQLYWSTPQVFIPAATFEQVYREASGGNPYEFEQLAVIVEDQSFIRQAMTELRRALPEYTAVTVADQVTMAEARGLPEKAYQAPPQVRGDPSLRTQVGVPMDLGPAMTLLLYLIAAMIVAANMVLLVTSRRQEIGVLRAVGAKGRDVVLMILTETAALSLGGALIGFTVVRFAATWNLLSNRVGLARVGLLTLTDLGRVVGLTLAMAVVFGLFPAFRMARVSAMEVLRND